jgi:hypothetical protein
LSGADLSISDLNSFFVPPVNENAGAEVNQTWQPPTLHYLDLSRVPQISLSTLFNSNKCFLVSPRSMPLDVIELSEKLIAPLRDRTKSTRSNGWVVREIGRRGWYVREPVKTDGVVADDGSRWWKMGARWWGMSNIPVTVGEGGGIYGHYMFKKGSDFVLSTLFFFLGEVCFVFNYCYFTIFSWHALMARKLHLERFDDFR